MSQGVLGHDCTAVEFKLHCISWFALHCISWFERISCRCGAGMDWTHSSKPPSVLQLMELNGFWPPPLNKLQCICPSINGDLFHLYSALPGENRPGLAFGRSCFQDRDPPPTLNPPIIVCLRHCHCLSTQTRELECELKSSDQSSPSSKQNWGNSCCIVYWGRPGVPGRLGLTVLMSLSFETIIVIMMRSMIMIIAKVVQLVSWGISNVISLPVINISAIKLIIMILIDILIRSIIMIIIVHWRWTGLRCLWS